TLGQLPDRPYFIFCATDMAFGVNWVFERDQAGDYQAGYLRPAPPEWPVGLAVAASSCFPPLFGPLPLPLRHRRLVDGPYQPATTPPAAHRRPGADRRRRLRQHGPGTGVEVVPDGPGLRRRFAAGLPERPQPLPAAAALRRPEQQPGRRRPQALV